MKFFLKINSTVGPLECHFWLRMTKVVLTVMSLGHVHACLVAHFKWAFDDQNWKVKRDKVAV